MNISEEEEKQVKAMAKEKPVKGKESIRKNKWSTLSYATDKRLDLAI